MRTAAADLDFEEAARLRDEIKRLRATELAVMDDPTAKLPSPAGGGSAAAPSGGRGGVHGSATRRDGPHKPNLDQMGPAIESIPQSRPRSSLGRPGMRGGFKRRGR
jgi:excinuclease ABC subunit B